MPKYTINNGEGKKPTIITSQEELTPEELDYIDKQHSQKAEPSISKMDQLKSDPALVGKTQGSFLGDVGREALEAVPLKGSLDALKAGYQRGQQALSPEVLGINLPGRKVLGAGLGSLLGGTQAAGTVFNPITKGLGWVPKVAQASGETLGGDTSGAQQTLTGQREVLPNLKQETSESTLKNIASDLYLMARKDPVNAAFMIETLRSPTATKAALEKNIANPLSKAASKVGEPIGRAVEAMKKTPEEKLSKYAETYRDILAPGKGDIKKVEIKSGRELNDSYKLAAEEGLILEKSSDNKLDTGRARSQLQEKKELLESQLSEAIASKPEKSFNILELAEKAKIRAREIFKNDAEYEAALKTVDNEAAAIVRNRGENINGTVLNDIKKGMWGKGYDAMAPNSNKIARAIGNVAKEAIETAYRDSDIKGLNSKLGDYITLENLLENSHGKVIARGKIGKYAAQGIGAVAGHSLGIPVAGELGGAWLGGKVSDYIVDPARITGRMARNIEQMNPALKDKLLREAAINHQRKYIPIPYIPFPSGEPSNILQYPKQNQS